MGLPQPFWGTAELLSLLQAYDREFLASMMETVEDIPKEAIMKGSHGTGSTTENI